MKKLFTILFLINFYFLSAQFYDEKRGLNALNDLNFYDYLFDSDYKDYKEERYHDNYLDKKQKLKVVGKYKNGKSRHGIWKVYYENGQLAAEGEYDNGDEIGVWKSYYPNGQIEVIRFYNDNSKPWTFYYPDGTLKAEATYLEKDENGKYYVSWMNYDEKGNLSSKGYSSYKRQSDKYGDWEFYYSDNKIKKTESYINGKIHGKSTHYYENGNISMIGNYDKDEPVGEWKYYQRGGELHEEGKVTYTGKNGEWKMYYWSGELFAIGNYSSNREYGEWKYYYKNGTIKEIGEYKDGKNKVNIWKYYYQNGKIEKEGIYVDNRKNGFWKEYHENGGVFSEGAYENNYKNGKWKYYYQNSKIKAEGNFQDDKKIGDWKYYYETGSVQEITNYEKSGTGLVERVMLYYPNGNLLGTQSHNNKIVSYLEYFDESGKKILENGTGKLIQYGDNGKKSYEAYYINSIRDGKATWYHSNGQIDQEAIYKYDPESKDSDKSLRWEIISSYDRNGKPREKGTLKEGNGTWISYNEDGSKSITTYKNGKKID